MAFSSISLSAVDAVTRPSSLVQAQVDNYTDNRFGQVAVGGRLTVFYLMNLVMYAGPLTLAGFGQSAVTITPTPTMEAFIGLFATDVAAGLDFLVRLFINSAYLFIASVLVFVTFHIGVLVTRSSAGILQSMHTVAYSAGIYLAVIFTLVWYVSTAAPIQVADDWLITLQKQYIYFFIDFLNAGVDLPTGRPTSVDLSQLTIQGQLALTGIVISVGYFLYSLYLGAVINHDTTRFEALMAVITVSVAPAVYVIGSIMLVVFVEIQDLIPGFIP